MNILAIETSCDETSAAIIQGPQDFPIKQSDVSTDTENTPASKSHALADSGNDTSSSKTPQILANVIVSQIGGIEI